MMVKTKFPEVRLIENKKNTGFAYANNQAIRIAQRRIILLFKSGYCCEEELSKSNCFYGRSS